MENDKVEHADDHELVCVNDKLRKEVDILFTDEERKKRFIEVLLGSVEESHAIMNTLGMLLEFPNMMQDAEFRMEMQESMVKHKLALAELLKKMKTLS